ncbi:hypothetical protein HDU97_002607 [Phlyctochytrium planicorne]|nr:hypothetical protein HDU97_002607 [Phlyctochytrium planicorne]
MGTAAGTILLILLISVGNILFQRNFFHIVIKCYYIIPTVLFFVRRKFNSVNLTGWWLTLMQAVSGNNSVHISKNFGPGSVGLRLLYLYRFAESKAAWRRTLANGTHSGVIPSSSSSAVTGGTQNFDTQSRSNESTGSYPGSYSTSERKGGAGYPPSRPSVSKDGEAMVSVDLASGRLHMPASVIQNQQRSRVQAAAEETPENMFGNPEVANYSNWWFENREKVADYKLARIVAIVGGVLFCYCVALAFVPDVGLFPKVINAPFGPGGSNFDGVSNIGEGGIVKDGDLSSDSCSQFSWPFFPLLLIEIVFTFFIFPILLYLLRNINDNHGIRVDIFIAIIFTFIAVTLHLALTFSKKFSTLVNQYLFMNIVIYITFLTSVIIPVYRSYKEQRARERNLSMGLSLASFKRVLEDPALVREFKQFCVKDFSVENIMFYEEVRHLKAKVLATSNSEWNATLNPPPTNNMQEPHIKSNQSTKLSLFQKRLFTNPNKSSNNFTPSLNQGDWGYHQRGTSIDSQFNDTPNEIPLQPMSHSSSTSNIPSSPISDVTLQEERIPSLDSLAKRPIPNRLIPSYTLVHRTFTLPASAPLEINIPSDVRNAICLAFETGTVTVDTFDKAVEFVTDNMFYNSFSKFYTKISIGRRGTTGGDGGEGGDRAANRTRVLG